MSAHDLYQRWIDELWCGHIEVAEELVGDDFVGHWPDRSVHGVEELGYLISQTHDMLAPLTFAIEVGPLVQDNLVAGRWRGRGSQDGTPVEFIGNDILRLHEGKFVEYCVASATLPQ